jgi:hypothetical protein
VYFDKDATENFDGEKDAHKMPNAKGTPNLYMMSADGKKTAINGLPHFERETTVPLVVHTAAAGDYKFEVIDLSNIDENIAVYLTDTLTKSMTDLRKNKEVSVKMGLEKNNGRFALLFRKNGVTANEIDGLAVFPNPNDGSFSLQIANEQNGNYRLKLTDLSGRVIAEQEIVKEYNLFSQELRLSPDAKGLFLLEVQNATERKVVKIIVR